MENKRLIAAAKYAVWLRNYQRARVRALTRLAKAYPDQYKELFEEEKLNDHTQGKAWVDVHGNTRSNMDTNAGANTDRGRDTTHQTRNRQGTDRQGAGEL
jgi:hypothetical protein